MGDVVPMFPLEGVVFPGTGTVLHVFEPRYLQLVDRMLEDRRTFGTALIERGSEVGGGDSRLSTGSLVEVTAHRVLEGHRREVTIVALERLAVERWLPDDPHPWAEVHSWPDEGEDGEPDIAGVWQRFERMVQLMNEHGAAIRMPELTLDGGPVLASFQLAAMSPLGPLDRYRLLEAVGPVSRLAMLAGMLDEHLEMMGLGLQ